MDGGWVYTVVAEVGRHAMWPYTLYARPTVERAALPDARAPGLTSETTCRYDVYPADIRNRIGNGEIEVVAGAVAW